MEDQYSLLGTEKKMSLPQLHSEARSVSPWHLQQLTGECGGSVS